MTSFGVLGLAILVCLLGLASSAATGDKGGIVTESQGTLIFSSILWRHGDRAPAAFYPTDPYSSPSNWPIGLGELSNLGKNQHFKFGKWLRERFDEVFLPKPYSENHIYVRSTDVDRTIASALSNMAGLYPPTGDQVWNKTIKWQPIPVHNVPAANDYIIGGTLPPCPVYDQALAEVFNSPVVSSVVAEYKTQIDNLLQNAGENVNVSLSDVLMDVLLIRDTLFVESSNNKPLPDWTKSIYPSPWLDKVALLYYILPSYTPLLAKFRTGYFLKDVLDRSTSKANGTLSPDISLYIYSAHDINISTVLQGLGMWDNQFPQYASALMFEVRVHEGTPYLEIYYKRSASATKAELLFIPKCGFSCELAKVYKVFENILPKNEFSVECKA